MINMIIDDVDEKIVKKIDALDLAGLEPIVKKLYSLKQHEVKVGIIIFYLFIY